MFVKPRRLAVGAAVLAPVVSVGAPVAHAATTPPPPAKNYCTLNAVTDAQFKAGVRSVSVCFATQQEALAAVSGGGAVTTSFGFVLPVLATYTASRNGTGYPQVVYGASCDTKVSAIPADWQIASFSKGMCSSAKNYMGRDFTGQAVVSSGAFYQFNDPFLRNIQSMTFAA